MTKSAFTAGILSTLSNHQGPLQGLWSQWTALIRLWVVHVRLLPTTVLTYVASCGLSLFQPLILKTQHYCLCPNERTRAAVLLFESTCVVLWNSNPWLINVHTINHIAKALATASYMILQWKSITVSHSNMSSCIYSVICRFRQLASYLIAHSYSVASYTHRSHWIKSAYVCDYTIGFWVSTYCWIRLASY